MSVFIRKVSLANYRSIAQCEVELGPVTFLVGANGSGKSNFLDALAFTGDSLEFGPEHALKIRGGIEDVLRHSAARTQDLAIRIDFDIDAVAGHYALRLDAKPEGAWSIRREECRFGPAYFSVRDGVLHDPGRRIMPPVARDRLYLVNAAGLPEFRRVYDGLTATVFYDLRLGVLRDLQVPAAAQVLDFQGSNLAGVVRNLDRPESRPTKQRILEYLQRVIPEVTEFHERRLGPKSTIEFLQQIEDAAQPWPFLASSMSDGTLRAFALLVALFPADEHPLRLVGIDEPETGLHPAAARVIRDAILEASERTQVVVTSHSADLLDDSAIDESMLRAVVAHSNPTVIGRVSESTRSTLRDHLFTAGELLRIHQLEIDPATRNPRPIRFFEGDDE